jgi:DNA-binding transcriptional regulator GbsR (MarR family)
MHSPVKTLSTASDALPVLARLLYALGFPRSCARILAALYLSDRPLTSKELIDITGYSKSSVSAAMKMLEGRKLVRKLRQGRLGSYTPSVSLSQLFLEYQVSLLKRTRARVRELRARANATLREKLEHLELELERLISKLGGDAE